MATKLNPSPGDCYANALLDEHHFTLLARDPDAPEAVRYWVTLRQARIGRGEKPASDNKMLFEALRCATDMAVWREENKLVTIPYAQDDPLFEGAVQPFVGPRWHHEKPPTTDEMFAALAQELIRTRADLTRAREQIADLKAEHLSEFEGADGFLLNEKGDVVPLYKVPPPMTYTDSVFPDSHANVVVNEAHSREIETYRSTRAFERK